ncbi:hypothetical protein PR048_000495 [Dryococelus australis]|uniref:Uncharacterized protein n=1 Tax=Dryococelus australis TaxID=614101 RepID=A0ABQ9IES3_9NEOP|nr:hypothetical protein PR048_000495 [Dryococelus australis]
MSYSSCPSVPVRSLQVQSLAKPPNTGPRVHLATSSPTIEMQRPEFSGRTNEYLVLFLNDCEQEMRENQIPTKQWVGSKGYCPHPPPFISKPTVNPAASVDELAERAKEIEQYHHTLSRVTTPARATKATGPAHSSDHPQGAARLLLCPRPAMLLALPGQPLLQGLPDPLSSGKENPSSSTAKNIATQERSKKHSSIGVAPGEIATARVDPRRAHDVTASAHARQTDCVVAAGGFMIVARRKGKARAGLPGLASCVTDNFGATAKQPDTTEQLSIQSSSHGRQPHTQAKWRQWPDKMSEPRYAASALNPLASRQPSYSGVFLHRAVANQKQRACFQKFWQPRGKKKQGNSQRWRNHNTQSKTSKWQGTLETPELILDALRQSVLALFGPTTGIGKSREFNYPLARLHSHVYTRASGACSLVPAPESSQCYYTPGTRYLFPWRSAIGSESSRVCLMKCEPIAKGQLPSFSITLAPLPLPIHAFPRHAIRSLWILVFCTLVQEMSQQLPKIHVGSQFVRHIPGELEPIRNLQENKDPIPYYLLCEPMRMKRGEYGVAPECKSGENERSPRKPTDLGHHLARFPCERPRRISNPFRLVGGRALYALRHHGTPNSRAADSGRIVFGRYLKNALDYCPCSLIASPGAMNLPDVAEFRAIEERVAASEREVCDCGYSAVEVAAGRLDYWTRCHNTLMWGAMVDERLACSPSTIANRIQSPTRLISPDFLRIPRSCISASLHSHLTSPSSLLKTSF